MMGSKSVPLYSGNYVYVWFSLWWELSMVLFMVGTKYGPLYGGK